MPNPVHAGAARRCAVDGVTAPALAKYAGTTAAVAIDPRSALIALAKHAKNPIAVNRGPAWTASFDTIACATSPEHSDAAACLSRYHTRHDHLRCYQARLYRTGELPQTPFPTELVQMP